MWALAIVSGDGHDGGIPQSFKPLSLAIIARKWCNRRPSRANTETSGRLVGIHSAGDKCAVVLKLLRLNKGTAQQLNKVM